jgi:polysaccharide biosynthesis/export protein
MKIRSCLALLAAMTPAGCSQVPTAGPTTTQILDQASQDSHRHFDLIDVDDRVIATLAKRPVAAPAFGFDHEGKPPQPTIGIGDTVTVSIWEASGGALFGEAAPPSTGSTAGAGANGGAVRNAILPEQVVGADGGITVPFAGRVYVAGRTIPQVEHTIQNLLADHVIEPQVIVTIGKDISSDVSVFGEVVNGARIPLSDRGDHLLDVIASAGGAKAPLYDTYVRIERDGEVATIPMDRMTAEPQENIFVWPGDVITLIRNPRTFSVFGATTNNPVIPIDAEQMNLAQALAKAGGLQDSRADPAGVFLFRFEPPSLVKELGAPEIEATRNGLSPVLYHLNLHEIAGYFLAEQFPIQNNDVIYVANASLTDLQKLFTLIGTITGPVITGAVVARPSGS